MERSGRRRAIVWQVALFEIGLFGLACLLGRLLGSSPLASLRATWPGILWGIASAVPPILAMLWSLRARAAPFPRLRREVYSRVIPLFAGCSIPDLAIVSAVAGVGEETLFRGLIQQGLARSMGPLAGLLLASAIFGLLHLVTPAYALLAGIFGAYLGWLAVATGNLLVPILAHALYDLAALLCLLRRRAPTSSPSLPCRSS
ncbi:MAG: lysostaphin resistance A-like protein [Acidobacteriota bacterium]